MLLSDDWMYPQCLRQMIDVAEPNPRIALVSAYRLIEERPDCFGVPVGQSSFPGTEPCRWQLLGTAYPFGSQSTVMYSAQVVRNRAPSFFPENRFFMDVDVAFRILRDADFGFVHQVLTFSRYQPETVTDTASHFNWWPLLQYLMMEQYGRDFLTGQEFEARYDEVTTEMYRGLGEQWLKDRFRFRKKKGFWEFQRQHLGDIGVELRPTLLARGVVAAGLSLLGSPSTFVEEGAERDVQGGVRPLDGSKARCTEDRCVCCAVADRRPWSASPDATKRTRRRLGDLWRIAERAVHRLLR